MSEPARAGATPEQLEVGRSIHRFAEELYPICRSITGDGVRETLRRIAQRIPIDVHEVPSGTEVLDWTVPSEWNIRDAWVKNAAGERVIDFGQHNLHVVNYSVPIRERMTLAELEPHLHTLPDRPDWIPYRTSYYNETWGFCLSERQLQSLRAADRGEVYEVVIDSSLEPGHLTYGELLLPGDSDREIVLSSHICHPSLCNDNLSGVGIAVHLAQLLGELPHRHSIRFLFIPGTIGSITWLARNRERADRIAHGLTLVCLGDASPVTFKKTFGGEAELDRVVPRVLEESGVACDVIDFFPYGYDERQFNSPGFRLPFGSLLRGRHGEFPEYHTSGDDPSFVQPEHLAESFEIARRVVAALDANRRYRSLAPYAEPQLGKRGVYRAMGGESNPGELQMAILWMLSCADGEHDLIAVGERSGLGLDTLARAAEVLLEQALLEVVD